MLENCCEGETKNNSTCFFFFVHRKERVVQTLPKGGEGDKREQRSRHKTVEDNSIHRVFGVGRALGSVIFFLSFLSQPNVFLVLSERLFESKADEMKPPNLLPIPTHSPLLASLPSPNELIKKKSPQPNPTNPSKSSSIKFKKVDQFTKVLI